MQSENYKIMAEKTLEERLSELYEKIDHRDQFFDKDLKTLIDGIRDAREHGGTASVDVTPIVGGYKIVITDSEGVEHVAEVKDGGDAYEVYKSTVPEGQSPMTKEEWLETLKGADGQDGAPGHNPCLGRFPAVPNPMPNGQIGDYLYVDITTVDPNTQEETTTTTVYHYGSNGWDNGAAIDAEHPTLASGQDVTAVHIKDENGDEVQGPANVLSAEAGADLKKEIDVINEDLNGVHIPKATVGQISSVGSWNKASTTSHYSIPITPGATIRLIASSVYTRWTLLKTYPNQIVAGAAVDYATGYESGEGIFPYIQLSANADTGNIVASSDANFLYVAGDVRTPSAIYINGINIIDGVAGLKESVDKNTSDITTLQERVGDIEEDVEELSSSVESVVQEVEGFADDIDSIKETLYGEQPHEYPPLDSNILVNAVINSNGAVNATSPRCGYYIPLLGGEHISGKASVGRRMLYCCVKSIVTTSGQAADFATGWSGTQNSTIGGSVEFTAPNDARYLYIGHIVTSDATSINDPAELVINNWDVINQEYIGDDLDEGLVERVEDLEENTAFHGLLKITVAEHNEGRYHYGNQPYGISQSDWDTAVASWKSLLTKTNSDFLSLMEHKPILNAAEDGVTDVNSYDELYKQFYPYRVDADTLSSSTFQIALYSKYPIKNYEKVYFLSPSTRYYNKFLVDVNGIEICFIIQKGYVGVPDSPEAAIRVAEFTQMVTDTANNPIVIIPIDTNGYSEDFDVFRNNGYQLGNFGYWGGKITSGISDTYPQGHTKFDNIIVKGLNINSFDVCDEHATSDHFPTMATLTRLFE